MVNISSVGFTVAYIVSRFPYEYETFVLREVEALNRIVSPSVPVFSLKPRLDRNLEPEAREFLQTTYYPSLSRVTRALPFLLGSAASRACLQEVCHAYRNRPVVLLKAVTTLSLAAAIIPVLAELKIGLVHAHWATMPGLAAYFIKRVAGIPYSITAHAWDIYAETTMLREKLQSAETIVTCTMANRDALVELGASTQRVVVSYHGLDFSSLPRPVFRRDRALRILAVGRLVEQKGFADLIEACGLLRDRGVEFRCRIIGKGPLARELKRMISVLRLDPQIALLGNRPLSEVFAAYRWATVLCVPSVVARDGDRDGIPNVIAEAMSQGLPVVASCVSGIPEIVRANKTGWLVPPGDPISLAAVFREIPVTPRETSRRAVAAYRLVRGHFDASENTARLLQLLLAAARARAEAGRRDSPRDS